MIFIPSLGSKRLFFESYAHMTPAQKKEVENQRLEFVLDRFPTGPNDPTRPVVGRYTKYEYPDRSRMNFYANPDFVVPEIFFEVMNGRMPEDTPSDPKAVAKSNL